MEQDVANGPVVIPDKMYKILIAEDDSISYTILKKNIQKISSEILHAVTGLEAIEICRNHPDLDLILMDLRMPVMNGQDATRQIRLFNNKVIIIAQPAQVLLDDRKMTEEAGCDDYISKPIDYALLHELIKKHCN